MSLRRALPLVVALAALSAACGDEKSGDCAAPLERCDDACVDTATDPANCGACGTACVDGNYCHEGACVARCADPLVACEGGCFDTDYDPDHCGGCDTRCSAGKYCDSGRCTATCSGKLCGGRCVDAENDRRNCGGCDLTCDPGQVCSNGACSATCAQPLSVCGEGEDAHCVDLGGNVFNCGECGHACNEGEVCSAGECLVRCGPGLTLCGDACVDLGSDEAHCGACGTTCETGQTCEGGACTCPAGSGVCDGTCIDLAGDPANCGGCGVVCEDGTECRSGRCLVPICDGPLGLPGLPDIELGASALAVVAADFIPDEAGGLLDLAVLRAGGGDLIVLENLGGGRFRRATSFPAGGTALGLAAGDLDGDGRPDIALALGDAGVGLVFNTESGWEGPNVYPATDMRMVAVTVADLDPSTPLPEVIAADYRNSRIDVLRNTGAGWNWGAVTTTAKGPQALATGDLDGDGKLDVAIACDDNGAGAVTLAMGDGSGNFASSLQFAIGRSPTGLAIGDVDGDGDADLAAARALEPAGVVLINRGDGTLIELREIPGGAVGAIALADLDGDGDLDVLGAGVDQGLVAAKNDGTGYFPASTALFGGAGILGMAVGDLDRDGRPDLATANPGSDDVSVLLNRGDGTFASRRRWTGFEGVSPALALADFDGNGLDDLVIAQGTPGEAAALLSDEHGGFRDPLPIFVAGGASELAAGDVDGDGSPDVVVSGPGGVTVLLGNGGSTFTVAAVFPVLPAAGPVILGDFDGDGWLDIAAIERNRHQVWVIPNRAFADTQVYDVLAQPSSLAVGDVDGDGKVDLAVGSRAGGIQILRGVGFGRFGPGETVDEVAAAVAIGDVTGDGTADLVAANWERDQVVVFPGGAAGVGAAVRHATGQVPTSLAIADLDGDLRNDVLAANFLTGDVSLLQGRADGTLAPAGRFAAGIRPPISTPEDDQIVVAIGQLDRDLRPDPVVYNDQGVFVLGTACLAPAPE